MGVGSSREIEEQLEAALALLDAARSKQDTLRSENDALQARITAQADLLRERPTAQPVRQYAHCLVPTCP